MIKVDSQVGGDHYQHMKIQPIQYILANNMGFCEGAIIKYISRYKAKGAQIDDLKKIKQFCDFLIAEQVMKLENAQASDTCQCES
jgi:hypothetical protein